jgi:hypothetical protein
LAKRYSKRQRASWEVPAPNSPIYSSKAAKLFAIKPSPLRSECLDSEPTKTKIRLVLRTFGYSFTSSSRFRPRELGLFSVPTPLVSSSLHRSSNRAGYGETSNWCAKGQYRPSVGSADTICAAKQAFAGTPEVLGTPAVQVEQIIFDK